MKHDSDMDYEAVPGTLANQFLIAMPHMDDPWFAHTVTYLWKHSEEGALGIVINKPSNMRVAELLSELGIETAQKRGDIIFHSQRVMSGGPVEKNKGFILHESGREWEYTLPVTRELSLSMSKDILADIAAGKGPENYMVALGCAGWEAGQLEKEISENFWLTVPAIPALIFSSDHAGKANAAASILGVNLSQLSSFAGHS
ncbi:MAG: YqgE/AlgH family protein [Pseudohongiellaceae bacterium]